MYKRQVRSRAEDFLRDMPSGRESKGEKMLIGAHKGTLGHLLAAMLKLPLDGYWLSLIHIYHPLLREQYLQLYNVTTILCVSVAQLDRATAF